MAGTVQTFLKVLIGANTKGFRKDMGDGEKAVQRFASETKTALDQFASVFGVDLDDARKRLKDMSSGLTTMEKGIKASTQGLTGFAKGWAILKNVMLASGIGAIVLALASLAVYFTKTEQGSKQLASGMAQLKAVGNVLIDHFAKLGEAVFNLATYQFKKAGQNIKEAFTGVGEKIDNARIMAKALSESMYELANQEREFNVRSSEQNIVLEQLRLKTKDLELTARQRLDALLSSSKIEKQINREALDIASQKILNAQTELSLDKDNKDKKDALAQAYINYNNLVSQSIQFERSLAREKNALVKEMKAELEAIKEANALNKLYIAPKPLTKGQDKSQLMPNMIKDVKEGSALFDVMGQVAVEATNEIQEGFKNASAGIFEFLGAVAVGRGGIGSFGTLVGGVFADMAINVGKIAIGAGMAVLGIKKALMTLNPWVAIAAGGALVALGAAAKGALANAAEGSGAATALATGSGGGFNYTSGVSPAAQQKEFIITLQGELRAKGPDLVYVVEKENARRRVST